MLQSKIRKRANIRNQVPDPEYQWELTDSHLDISNKSQEVSHFPAGDHKASINTRARKHNHNFIYGMVKKLSYNGVKYNKKNYNMYYML